MAKIPFSKLGIKLNTAIATVSWGEYEIEVRKYLPLEEKAELISKVLNYSVDDLGYYNPLKVEVFLALETVYAYTNLSFTAKMKEEGLKTYDLLIGSGLFDKIIEAIPENEWQSIQNSAWEVIDNIYEYQNSAVGILNTIKNDYNNVNLDLAAIQDKINDPDSLELLKQIAPLLNLENIDNVVNLDQNK